MLNHKIDLVNVADFKLDNQLCRSSSLTLVIKNFERLEVQERVLKRQQGLIVPRSEPRDGAIGIVSLVRNSVDTDQLYENCEVECSSPYEFLLTQEGCKYYNSFDAIFCKNSKGIKRYTDALMRRVHSIDISSTLERVLVSASGFDTLHILDLDLNSIEVISIWQIQPRLAVRNGLQFVLDKFESNTLAKEKTTSSNKIKKVLASEIPTGLGVQESPFYVNGARFTSTGGVLFTGYNSQSLFLYFDHELREFDLGLKAPHCFCEIAGSDSRHMYGVVDSGAGRIVYLNDELQESRVLDFSLLSKPARLEKKHEWLQYAHFAKGGSIVYAADQIRCAIHILDLNSRTRRMIEIPREWSLHGITPL